MDTLLAKLCHWGDPARRCAAEGSRSPLLSCLQLLLPICVNAAHNVHIAINVRADCGVRRRRRRRRHRRTKPPAPALLPCRARNEAGAFYDRVIFQASAVLWLAVVIFKTLWQERLPCEHGAEGRMLGHTTCYSFDHISA